jgi:tRNA A-37 threonylcarbamoyl transferase component Bud32
MSSVPPAHSTPGRASAAAEDDAFAATVVEDMFDGDEPESVPGSTPVDERRLLTMPTIGHVGRYALKHQLGAGGLGAVYAALDPLLSRPIAVKMLRVDDLGVEQREGLEQQLLAEARAAAGLNHPNIVTVYDAGLAEEGVYIAMERLQGRDLRQLLADGWRPDAVQAARIAKRLADALSYAHGHGVVHCDIKPANIFMTGRTQPKLLDFGIARVTAGRFDAAATSVDISAETSTVPPPELGSPYYVSPEHLRGEALDARADVYGVGVVLYELLTGQRAFDGGGLDAIRHAVLEAPVAPAHTVNPKVDAALSGIVARAMARAPGDRYRSARQLSRALRTWISEETNGLGHKVSRHSRMGYVWAAGATVALVLSAAAWLMIPRDDGGASAQAAAVPAAAPATAQAATPAPAPTVPEPIAVAAAPVAPPPEAKPAVKAASPAPATRPVRAKERAPRDPAPQVAPAPAVAAAPVLGTVQIAVSPWGQVEVDGKPAGTTPPLSRLTLPVGTHQIVVRNDDFPAYSTSITVTEEKPVTLRHRFGS